MQLIYVREGFVGSYWMMSDELSYHLYICKVNKLACESLSNVSGPAC